MSIPTLFVVAGFVLAALAGVMIFFASLRRIIPGFRIWALSQASAAAGIILLASRGRTSALVSVLLANLLILAHPLLAIEGFQRFYALPPPRRRWPGFLLGGAALALIAWFHWVHPELRVRIAVFGAAAAALHAAAGLSPLRSPEARASRAQWVISAFYVVMGASYLSRAAYAALVLSTADLFADPTLPPQVLAVVVGDVIVVCSLIYLSFERAGARLEENEGRLRLALQAVRGGSWETDLRTGRTFWSSGLFELLGLPPGSRRPSREAWLASIHPDDRARMNLAIDAALRGHGELEEECRLASAPDRWVLARGRTVPGGGVRPTHVMGIVLDVTDRKRSEEALRAIERERAHRESAARFQALIEKSTDIIYVIGPDRAVRYCSPGVTAALGWRADELLGRTGLELIHPEDEERVADRFRASLAAPGGTTELRFRMRHRDGSWRLVDAVVRNQLADPVLAGVVVNARDITEQERLQEQLFEVQRLEGIGQLAGGVAHDFNNLLTAILSGAQGIRESLEEGTPPLVDDLQAVLDAGARASELTRQLLAFARRQPIAPAPLDPGALLRDLELLVRRLLPESIALRLELTPGAWPVRADAGQLRQVILNLAVNARDAMPAGGELVLAVKGESLDGQAAAAVGASGPGDWVRLTVRDNGSGMSAEARAHLFEPFFTTKMLGRGTGLGLAVVHGIVKQSEGAIAVESEAGLGTSIHVYLPRCAEPAARLPPSPKPASRSGGNEAVLLVEDEPAVRAVAERTLRRAGYDVLVASDAEEALALAPPRDGLDLLVTDVVMPGMNGRELADRLLRGHPGLRVLFISGFTRDAVAQHGVIEEGVELLEKPFVGATLLARVRDVLDRPESR